MTVSEGIARIQSFRKQVPLVEKNENITFFNLSFQPPMNSIVANTINEYVDWGLYNPNPKPLWQQKAEETRELVAKYLNASSSDSIAFTRDTTEGLNLFQRSMHFQPGDNVVLLDGEHPNHGFGWISLQEAGLEVRLIPSKDIYYADASTFEPYVDEKTKAIGISSVMFHSGQLNNVKDICDKFRPENIHVLVDMTQQVGLSSIDVQELNVSACAFACHKGLSCPTGLGVLYVAPDVLPQLKNVPPIVGAGAIENLDANLLVNLNPIYFSTARRFEHLNKSLITTLCLNNYLSFLMDIGFENIEQYLRELGKLLVDELSKLGVTIIGSKDPKKRSTHSYVAKILNPEWDAFLKSEGVYASQYRDGIRLSLGLYNNAADISRLANTIKKGVLNKIPFN